MYYYILYSYNKAKEKIFPIVTNLQKAFQYIEKHSHTNGPMQFHLNYSRVNFTFNGASRVALQGKIILGRGNVKALRQECAWWMQGKGGSGLLDVIEGESGSRWGEKGCLQGHGKGLMSRKDHCSVVNRLQGEMGRSHFKDYCSG